MDERSQEALVARLESSLAKLRAAVDTIPADRAIAAPASGGWSVLDIVEHLGIVEKRSLTRIHTAERGNGDPSRDVELVAFATDRTSKREAPAVLHPQGTFSSVNAALAAVSASRGETIAFCRTHNLAELAGLVTRHPLFGTLDAYQLALSAAIHMERHTEQIGETERSLAAAK